MEPPMSDGVYAKDVPHAFDEMRKREERKERIDPFWEDLKHDKEPKVNKPVLLNLMQDLKDEGNMLFKEGLFDVSWMYYRNALFVVQILETRYYHDVEKEFKSTLFSNRAFCCLKKEMYSEAVKDCDSAVEIFPENVKAYYRKVVALKAQKKYKDALQTAEAGFLKQPMVFKDSVVDLKQLVLNEEVMSKRAPVVSKAEVSARSAASIAVGNKADEEWLTGTSVGVLEKQKEAANSKMPNKSKGVKGRSDAKMKLPEKALSEAARRQRNGNISDSDSDSSHSSLDEDEKFASTYVKAFKSDASNVAMPTKVRAHKDIGGSKGSTTHSAHGMGLDSFQSYSKGSSSTSSPVFGSPSSGRSSSASPVKSLSKEDVTAVLELQFPLQHECDFRLACDQCFLKIGEGARGYKFKELLNHSCTRNYLLLKSKEMRNVGWIHARCRPESRGSFFTTYKMCLQFMNSEPCKIGQRCSFPHSREELQLWTLDREGRFSIEGFIARLKQLKIDSSQIIDELKEQNKSTNIPGLNFAKPKPVQTPRQQYQHPLNRPPVQEPQHRATIANEPPQQMFTERQFQQQARFINEPTGSQHTITHGQPLPQSTPQSFIQQSHPATSSQWTTKPPAYSSNVPLLPTPISTTPVGLMGHRPPVAQGPLPNTIGQPFQSVMTPQRQSGLDFFGPPQSQNQYPVRQAPIPNPTNVVKQEDWAQRGSMLENPLRETHDFKLVCPSCFPFANYPGSYIFHPIPHKCEENVLAMFKKGSTIWLRVRERVNHRDFPGNYVYCNAIKHANPALCRYGESHCSFSHNEVEHYLWKLEKDGVFNITEFIVQNRSSVTSRGFSLKEILQKHGGHFCYVCKACFYSSPPRISDVGLNDTCRGNPGHSWSKFKILAHFGLGGQANIINQRAFLHKTAFFKICKYLHYCLSRINGECNFAHSVVERDLWMLERDTGVTREAVVAESNNLSGIQPQSADASLPATSANIKPDSSSPVQPQNIAPDNVADPETSCPFIIQEVCSTCWKNGTKSIQDSDKDRCEKKQHSNWQSNKIFLLAKINREIHPLPKKIPTGMNFVICKYIREKKKCGYTGAGLCQFAHSEMEIEAWKWMCKYNVSSLERLSECSKKTQQARSAAVRAEMQAGKGVVAMSRTAKAMLPSNQVFTPHYCQYCAVNCNSEKQWDQHTASDKHAFNVNSDKEHQWNCRQPPWGIPGSSYELCLRHMQGDNCLYSHTQDMYNLCRYAHSHEELDEWKERYEWRQMKRNMARQEKVFSYMDQLQEEYENVDSTVTVISEELDSVDVVSNQPLSIYKQEKNATYSWSFEIRTQKNLEKVALLENKDRLHFVLQGQELEKSCQIAPGSAFEDVDEHGMPCYKVGVKFTGGMFGSFSQWVILDFGFHPVLVRKLAVEVGDMSTHEKVKNLREQLKFDKWTPSNRRIVSLIRSLEDYEKLLLKQYKEPSSTESVITQHSVATDLNCHNYVHKMHKLLDLEELTRSKIISSYNLCTSIEFTNSIQEETHVYAHQGELFAKVPLNEYLTYDTDGGKLVLVSVRTVLFAPINSTNNVVYEADIVREDNFNYDGRGREFIYLCLPSNCVTQLQLSAGMSMEVEIQFQMNRLWFTMMHYAVDHLQETDIVFPNIAKIQSDWKDQHTLELRSNILNTDQMKAVRHIVAVRSGYMPPFVIYGPFGTGKTETIAQASLVLLKDRAEDVRILICAQSNSAADLYITKHLDPFVKKSRTAAKIMRVYQKDRRVNTVVPEVMKYCVLSSDGASFTIPLKEDILRHNIVIVTLATSLSLQFMELSGCFTHIFVDEAAQALETEVLMPLSLATEKTHIVLSGDHMQISPTVYSEEAQSQRFHQSLVERLFVYYDSFASQLSQTNPLNILLGINYRTKMEILRFISAIFYGGPDNLISQSNLPSVLGITPLKFYSVQGCEVQEPDSISYYNTSEVQEIVERVNELYSGWPSEWGQRSAKDIGVVTPYYEQVQFIRKALRKKHPDLRGVTVERVNNVQGKEFRALFICTVRTRHLLESPVFEKTARECDGEMGDFGFLSDRKLLNTALTRAQSFVAVVGDPVALCAVGECVSVWRTYLRHCQNMKSLYPDTISLNLIKQHVTQLLHSPAQEKLLQIARQAKQHSSLSFRNQPDLPTASSSEVWKSRKVASDVVTTSKSCIELVQTTPKASSSCNDNVSHVIFEAGDIIKQLAGESIKNAKQKEFLTKAGNREAQFGTSVNASIVVDMDHVVICEQDGHAVVQYDEEYDKKVAESANVRDYGLLDDSDPEMAQYNNMLLNELLTNNPAVFIKCIIHIESSRIYARAIECMPDFSEIIISNRNFCGRAFDKDEVVVEIICLESEIDCNDSSQTPVYGRVVGILNRFINPNHRLFVCMAEPQHTGVMIPINRGIQKIYNLTTESRVQRARKGHVCVYQLTIGNGIRFSHYEKVDPSNPNARLFVVRFLRWDDNLVFPIGVVISILSAGTDIESGMQILEMEYNITRHFKSETIETVQQLFPANFQFPQVFQRCHDIRDKWTFTIDSPVYEDLSNALSIEEVDDGNYVVGVHVTDLTYFVEKGDPIDIEAQCRGASHYPLNHETVSMFPARLSTDLCSLKPGTDRLTISVFLTVTKSGEIISAEPKKCIISSKQQFTLQEAEAIIHDTDANNDYLKSCILVLYQIACVWRRKRLGNAHVYHDIDIDNKLTPAATLMIQEITEMTNHKIAEILVGHFPLCVPLLRQNAPNPVALDDWKVTHASDAVNSIALTKPFLEGLSTCNCRVACSCIFKFMQDRKLGVKSQFDVYSVLWNAVVQAAESDDMPLVQNLIVAADSHPQISVALLNLNAIQDRCAYRCSGDSDIEDQGHYSMNVSHYVHFTNPLQRYMDVVVQRLVSAFLESKPLPYISQDISYICSQQTNLNMQATQFRDAVRMLHLSSAIKARPLVLYPIIEKTDSKSIHLAFPSLPSLPSSGKEIDLGLLDFSEEPVLDDVERSIDIKWQKRIYDLQDTDVGNAHTSLAVLNPEKFIWKIPPFKWQLLLISIREENMLKLRHTVSSVKDVVQDPSSSESFSVEVSSERKKGGKFDHYAQFSRKFQPCSVAQVQVSAKLIRGVLNPHLQLLNLTPKLDICLEHRSDPVSCFANILLHITKNYESEVDYLSIWHAVVSMETAKRSVYKDNSIILHNVHIDWQSVEALIGPFVAKFSIPVTFLKERQIKSSSHVSFDDLFKPENHKICQNYFSDYLCVRYNNISLDDDLALNENIALIVNNNATCSWVGHCAVLSVETKGSLLEITAHLQQSSVPLPETLRKSNIEMCSVEWICKPELSRNIELALNSLTSSSQLAKDIAVGRKPVTIVDYKDVDFLRTKQVTGFPVPSVSQAQAIQSALKQPFTVIHGPAGSGKSLLGARLAYLFAERNSHMSADGSGSNKVLVCGPSEKSLDVITSNLLATGADCPKLVRVYSNEVEQQQFPIPLEPVPTLKQKSRQECVVDPSLQAVSLHSLIRQPSNGLSQSITEFDMLFRLYSDDISEDQLVEYMKIVHTAEKMELNKAEIILCTCSTSASPKVTLNTNIQQIIIDDCNMCSEPESMIPISLYKDIMQVVLVGDPCQLKPSVMEKRAADSSLDVSLVDRYNDTALMLTTQFRMHEGIADFPSRQFYGGKLVCSTTEQRLPSTMNFWPTDVNKPVVFCHIAGNEENIPMITADGHTHSKTNLQEVNVSVKAAALMVKKYGVSATNIALISPYQAQIEALQQKLRKERVDGSNVYTVKDCQGQEWDFVIFSTVRSHTSTKVNKHPTQGWKSRNLGELADDHLVNVALTRARKGLIIVGNKDLLECDPVWRALLIYYAKNGNIVSANIFSGI